MRPSHKAQSSKVRGFRSDTPFALSLHRVLALIGLMVPGKEGVSLPPDAHWIYMYHEYKHIRVCSQRQSLQVNTYM